MGLIDDDSKITLQLYCEPLQRFRLAAEGHGAVQPPEPARPGRELLDPLPIWYRQSKSRWSAEPFPFHGSSAADGHVPFLGLAECLAQADPLGERLYVPRDRGRTRDRR